MFFKAYRSRKQAQAWRKQYDLQKALQEEREKQYLAEKDTAGFRFTLFGEPGWRVTEIKQVDETPMYDSTWDITLEAGESRRTFQVVRHNGQRFDFLCKELFAPGDPTEQQILALDCRDRIYYD